MMHGHARDIGPDEVRRSHDRQSNGLTNESTSLPEENLVEETGGSTTMRSQEAFSSGCMPERQLGRAINEPVDESTEPPSSIFHRLFSSRSSQFHNGTDYLKSEENRLSTFIDWRYQRTVRKEDLARNGFIYTGTGDKVRCVFCGIILHHWEPSDVVEQEHQKTSACCPFLRGDFVGNIPLHSFATSQHHHIASEPGPQLSGERASCRNNDSSQEQSEAVSTLQQPSVGEHSGNAVAGTNKATGNESSWSMRQTCTTEPVNPGMVLEPARLASFSSWPAQMSQRPEQMAQAGLYYTGDSDKVKCFHCNVLLFNWEPNDNPFREHARWFPDCQYLRLVKGEKFVEDVKNHRMTDDEVMEMASVQAVLFDGYSKVSVQRALTVLREKNVEMASVSADLLLSTLMELEPTATGPASSSSGQAQSEDFQLLQLENESLREKQQCKICMDQDVEVIFYPCRHFVCCASCSAGVSLCPICRVPIQNKHKVFMA